MEKARHDRRKDVNTRLDFGEGPREKVREDSLNARARAIEPGRVRVQNRLKYGSRHVLDRLGHRRPSAFDRLSDTYSPSTTRSCTQRTDSRDPSRGRGRTRILSASRDDRHKDRECPQRERDKSPPSVSKSDSSNGKRRKSKYHSTEEDDLNKPWMCEEENPFTPRIRNFESSRKTRMPNNIKTYDGTEDPEDHVKVFQATAQVERWAMPTWCYMFNSTLIGAARVWFDELPPESIDGYKDLKAAFLAYFMQQKKYVKDPVEIHNIKQKDEETIEDFMERFKTETGQLAKRLNEHVPKTIEEMMISTTAFIRGEAAAASKKKGHASWKPQDQPRRHSSDKRPDFRTNKFQPPPPMVTPVEKRSSSKFCYFHNDKGHSTNECMQLKKQIEELVRAGKLSHLIKEIKQGRDQSKTRKKETAAKDKPTAIYMVQSWQRIVKQKVIQSFKRVREIAFPQLTASNGTEGPLVIEVEMGGHVIHRMYIDGVEGGIATIRNTILIPTECASVTTSSVTPKKGRTHPANFTVALHPDFPDQEPSDMTGVPRFVAEHRLNIQEGYTLVRQKKRGQAPERARAIWLKKTKKRTKSDQNRTKTGS
nr:reverse transcriptase domain-containing protein [Tanacetum cinerariifolium]